MLSVFLAFSLWTLFFSSEFVSVRVFSDCCFSCLSLGTCDAHIFISSHDRSSTLCSTYTHVHRSTTWCLVGLIVPVDGPQAETKGQRRQHARICRALRFQFSLVTLECNLWNTTSTKRSTCLDGCDGRPSFRHFCHLFCVVLFCCGRLS